MSPVQYEILVMPGFVGLEVSAIADMLRISNRIAGTEVFAYRFVSDRAGLVQGAGGMCVNAVAFGAVPHTLIAVGNRGTGFLGRAAINRIARVRRQGGRVVLLAEAAAEFIGQTDTAGPITTHWENKSALLERLVGAEIADTLAESHDGLITAAGMGTTIDLMFALVAERLAPATLRNVAAVFLHDRVRPFDTRQPAQRAEMMLPKDPVLRAAVAVMETRLEEDLRMAEIAQVVGTTSRSLERKFGKAFGVPPLRFLRDLRLNKARVLVTSTSLPLVEIGLSCGLGQVENLSKLFRAKFGVSPAGMRRGR
jgi:transcriptional regulator GlxA family with amidase domain